MAKLSHSKLAVFPQVNGESTHKRGKRNNDEHNDRDEPYSWGSSDDRLVRLNSSNDGAMIMRQERRRDDGEDDKSPPD